MILERKRLLPAFGHVGTAIRQPAQLATAWQEGTLDPLVIPVFLATAAFGLSVYGMTMHLSQGAGAMLRGATLAPVAAGAAWLLALPALHIVGAALGSRLSAGSVLLAASASVAFAAMALLASVPISWFFQLALPEPGVSDAINLVVFIGVGACMADVLRRMLRAMEPGSHIFALVWLGLLGLIATELFVLLGLLGHPGGVF
ncbi:MAG: hypothetical protein ACI9WU_002925 [Myxococcota bacterium]|jgi:hypothetical protein